MSEQRKLATIMGIDVAGYSHAAEINEREAADAIARLRASLDEVVAQNNGRVFSTAGDGFMAEFPAAASGVAAAQSLLALVLERSLPRIRVGLHLGDVIVADGGDLLGHGVNVAARLMQMAEPNTAVVSQAVQAQMRQAADVVLKPLGRVQLDKMSERVEVYALAPKGAHFDRIGRRRLAVTIGSAALVTIAVCAILFLGWRAIAPPASVTPRLAVMRFDNLGTTDAFFAESVADELISELSRTPSLDVIARSSSFPLSGASATPANVARVLGATLVLTGSVQRAGESLRVHADLVEAPSGRELWNRTFQRPLSDVLLLQRDIAVEVARSVGLRVESHEARHVDPEAYDLYLRGRELYLHRLEGHTREARDLFQQAVQRDPNFAQAWVWYGAASQQVTGDETYNQPQTLTMYAAVLDAAAQVERLEPTWADSAQLRSDTYATVGQWLEAARYGRRSEALGLAQYTWRMNTGGARRLVETWRHTLALNPQNENMHAFFGSACIAAGDYVCAVDMERRALELNPSHPYAIFWLFDAARRTDREAARRLLSQYPEAWRASFASDASNERPHLLSLLGGPAVPVAELVRLSRSGRTSVASVVWELAQTGRTEAAAALLAQWGPSFQVDALYDPTLSALRRTPQFWALMRQKGLVDYWNQSHEWPDFCATEPICTQYLRR